MKKWFVAILLLFSITLPLNVNAGADQLQDQELINSAPYIKPLKENGKKILFDNTHAQTAGAADWVIDGGFSDFADGLVKEGYYVKELRKFTPITLQDLKDYDVFVIPEANVPYKAEEQNAIAAYVSGGGSVFYIGDHYNADRNKNRIDAPEAFNGFRRGAYTDMTLGMDDGERNSQAMQGVVSRDWLNDTFGVRFRYNALDNIDAPMIMENTFGILDNVSDVALHAGGTIAIMDNKRAKGIVYPPEGLTKETNRWPNATDDGVYNGGGVAEGAYIAISKKDKGKAAFLGDSSLVEDASPKYRNEETGNLKRTYDGYSEKDDSRLLMQLINWLAIQEDYSDFSNKGINLSEKTSLHDFEIPENSTEPQAEPWGKPQKGYKWYDRSTFAAGSYGSNIDPDKLPKVEIIYDNLPVVGEEVKLKVIFTNYKANTVLKDYTLGIYNPTEGQNGLKQGEQVADTKVGEGEWKNNKSYSNTFDIQTDKYGNAEQEITVKVDIEGNYNIRLKQGKNNVITDTIVFATQNDVEKPQPNIDVEYSNRIAVGKESKVSIKFTDFSPNTNLRDYVLDVYSPVSYLGNEAGSGYAFVKSSDGKWSNKRDSSEPFDVLTDKDGNASLELTIRTTDAGDFILRLRKNNEEQFSSKIQSLWYLPS
ncbi:DNA-binding protein [Floricoccus penangensis]|uniref:DNA-binding protein n=1 Tax=Floricoccus penangensis TaxID=1859475 RepID=UPI00203E0E30|nr:DNA-binding protein [Floricoccus penangensis]URZ87520.1 DNA-binding protein [Floricoccus penangensis]